MAIKLDLKDKKLLYEIDFNARETYSKLAKKLNMSKRGVKYKLENLEKQKIILGYYPLLNLSKFGYYYFRVFVKFYNLSKDLKEKISKFILNDENIGWAIWYYGEYDIGFTIWAKTVTEFKKFANKFYASFDKNIKDRTESIGTEILFYKNRYLLKNKDSEKIIIQEREEDIKLDKLDILILKTLIKRPRLQIIELAELIKESPKRTAYRLKRLYREKIILGIRPIINHRVLGKTYYKIFVNFNNFNEEKINYLEHYIEDNPQIIYIIRALGTCDLDIELIVESNEDLFSFIEDLQSKFTNSIKEYKTMILTDTIKAKFLPF